jgi:hypothetical protein
MSVSQQSALMVQVWPFIWQAMPASFGWAQTNPLPPSATGTHGKQPLAGAPPSSE